MNTHSEYLNRFRRELEIMKYSRNTVKNYCGILRQFFLWCGRNKAGFSLDSIKQFLHSLAGKGLASNTLSLHINALKTFNKLVFKFLPMEDLRHPKKSKTLPYILSREEIVRLLNAITNEKHLLMISFLYGSGLRVSEVINIRIQDIDLERRRLIIRQGKGRKDRITILSKQMIERISKIVEKKDKRALLFESGRGGKYSKRTVQQIFSTALLKSGIKKHSTCHTLRHSFAAHLLEKGINIVHIQKLLGHRDIKTTLIYTKLAKNVLDDIDSPL